LVSYGFLFLWEDAWIKFDIFILVCELFGQVLASQLASAGKSLLLLRMMRLSPLARTLRPIARFRVLKVLAKSFLGSASIILNTVLLLMLIVYVFSIVGVEVIGMKDYPDSTEADRVVRAIACEYFPSLPATMLTLLQFVCLDTVAAIYRPLILYNGRLLVYFLLVILVIPISLMNLVTGVVVSSTSEHIQQDKADAQKHRKVKLAKVLRGIFVRLDEDQSGKVTREEIVNISEEDRDFLSISTNMGDPLTIFNALDPEHTGTLDVEEFCNGVWQLATSKATIKVQQTEKQVTSIFRRLEGFQSRQAKTKKSLRRVLALQKGLQDILQTPAVDHPGLRRNKSPRRACTF